MICDKIGESVTINEVIWTVGDHVKVVDESDEYYGLSGIITEIRTGEDKETENEGEDVYCAFDVPTNKAFIKTLEECFSRLYGTPKKLSDISLDLVIMDPDSLTKLKPFEVSYQLKLKRTVYETDEFAASNEILGSSINDTKETIIEDIEDVIDNAQNTVDDSNPFQIDSISTSKK